MKWHPRKRTDRLTLKDRIPQGGQNEGQCLSIDSDGKRPSNRKNTDFHTRQGGGCLSSSESVSAARDPHYDSTFKYHCWSESWLLKVIARRFRVLIKISRSHKLIFAQKWLFWWSNKVKRSWLGQYHRMTERIKQTAIPLLVKCPLLAV